MPEEPTTQQQRDRERLVRFLDYVEAKARELAEKNGCADWAASAWWRVITDAPEGTVIGPANPRNELVYILHLNLHLDALRSALADGRTEAALMEMYDVGRHMELVGIRPFREGRKKAGKMRKGKTKTIIDPNDPKKQNRILLAPLVVRAYLDHRKKHPSQSETEAKERIAKRYGITRRTVDSYLKKTGKN